MDVKILIITETLNIAVKAGLLHIREVPCSDTDIEIGYAIGFSWFSLVPPYREDGIVTQIRPRPLPPTSFLIRYSLLALLFDSTQSEILTASRSGLSGRKQKEDSVQKSKCRVT
jgi:hypothetical protein